MQQGYPGPLMRSPYSSNATESPASRSPSCFRTWRLAWMISPSIRSCFGRSNDHSISHFEWNTGALLLGFPSVGSWVTYGLGTENQNLPAFVVFYDPRGGPYNGPKNWGSGFLPASYQATVFRLNRRSDSRPSPPAKYVTPEQQRARLDHLARLNQQHEEASWG